MILVLVYTENKRRLIYTIYAVNSIVAKTWGKKYTRIVRVFNRQKYLGVFNRKIMTNNNNNKNEK